MTPIRIQTEDGHILEFPPGTTQEQIGNAVASFKSKATQLGQLPDPGAADTSQSALERFGPVLAEGLKEGVQAIGLPVDAVNGLLKVSGAPASDRPILGSKRIGEGIDATFNALGIPHRRATPGNLPENLVEIGGAVAPIAGPVNAARVLADKAPTLLGKAANAAKLALGEAGSVGVAASGRTLAENAFPNNKYAGMIGELIGFPAAAKLAPTASSLVRRGVAEGKRLLSEEGRMDLAASQIQANATNAESAAKNLDKPVNTPVTPAARTEDAGLIQQGKLAEQVDPAAGQLRGEKVFQQLRENLQKDLGANAESSKFVDAIRARQDRILSSVDEIIRSSAKKAESDLLEIPIVDKSAVSAATRTRMDEAYTRLRADEKAAYNAIEQDIPAGQSNLSATIADIKEQGANAREIPSDMIELAQSFLKDGVTVKKLQNIRSRILDEIGKATHGMTVDPNRAALLGNMQEAILKDIAEVPAVSGQLEDARALSLALNNRFNRGPIGKLRGFDSQGGLRTPEELTLNKLIKKGEQGKVNTDALLKANPGQETTSAIHDYAGTLFREYAAPNGKLDVNKALAFKQNYKEVLDNAPELRAQIDNAIESGNVNDIVIKNAKRIKDRFSTHSNKKQLAITFLDFDNPAEALDKIRRSGKTKQSLASLARTARRKGVLDGLRRIVYDDIIKHAETSKSVGGVKELSRAKAEKILTPEYIDSLEKAGIFNKQQVRGIHEFLRELNLENKFADIKARTGSSDTYSNVVGDTFRMAGLRFVAPEVTKGSGGAKLALATKIGKLSESIGKKLVNQKKVDELYRTALLDDPELLRLLLVRAKTKPQLVKKLRAINAHLATINLRSKDQKQHKPQLGQLPDRSK